MPTSRDNNKEKNGSKKQNHDPDLFMRQQVKKPRTDGNGGFSGIQPYQKNELYNKVAFLQQCTYCVISYYIADLFKGLAESIKMIPHCNPLHTTGLDFVSVTSVSMNLV